MLFVGGGAAPRRGDGRERRRRALARLARRPRATRRAGVGSRVSLQGNLDPCALAAPPAEIARRVRALARGRSRRARPHPEPRARRAARHARGGRARLHRRGARARGRAHEGRRLRDRPRCACWRCCRATRPTARATPATRPRRSGARPTASSSTARTSSHERRRSERRPLALRARALLREPLPLLRLQQADHEGPRARGGLPRRDRARDRRGARSRCGCRAPRRSCTGAAARPTWLAPGRDPAALYRALADAFPLPQRRRGLDRGRSARHQRGAPRGARRVRLQPHLDGRAGLRPARAGGGAPHPDAGADRAPGRGARATPASRA